MYFAAKIDKEKCTGCKLCVFACPEPNVIMFNKKEKKVDINAQRCKACGLCIEVCPKETIEIVNIVTS